MESSLSQRAFTREEEFEAGIWLGPVQRYSLGGRATRTKHGLSAFSPIEPAELREVEGGLVVIAIIAVLIGLLVPAVQ